MFQLFLVVLMYGIQSCHCQHCLDHEEKVSVTKKLLHLLLIVIKLRMAMVDTWHDVTLTPASMALHDRKRYVAPHFDYLD